MALGRLGVFTEWSGMADVINSIPVRFYMDNGQPHTTATYQHLVSTLQERTDITYLTAEPRTITLGSVQIEVLLLPSADSTDFNNRSVGLVLRVLRIVNRMTWFSICKI